MTKHAAKSTLPENDLTRSAYVTFQLEAIAKQLFDMNERQSKHETKMETKVEDIQKTINGFPEKYVSKMELTERLKPIETDVTSTNSNITWAVRIVIGAVLVALLGLVVYTQGAR